MKKAIFLLFLAPAAAGAYFMDPVSDICWECVFPVTIGANASLGGGPDAKTDAPALCACASEGNVTLGINLGFWEPLRTIEIVHKAFTFPSLGGAEIKGANFAPNHGRTPNAKKAGRRTSFYEVHWYHTPWLFLLEVLFDTRCLEQAPFDLAYLTEADPLWADSELNFLFNPEAVLFGSGPAVAACAADCASASAGAPLDALYWCAGCAGSLFPLTGWQASHTTPKKAYSLLTQRFAMKLHREGVLWAAYGKKGQCGPVIEPIMAKSLYKTQMLYPSREMFCQPFGAETASRASMKTPAAAPDAVYLVWRRRDCCQGRSAL